MKSKKILKLCIMMAIVLLLSALCASCQNNQRNEINELHQTAVVKTELAEYGNFVWGEWGKIYRFNRKTETFFSACSDPECDGKCPVDCVMSYFAGVHDGRLYFCAWQQFTHNTLLAYQDVVTGETHVLKTMSAVEDPTGYSTFVDGEWWYYKCMLLKDGGDANKPSDYEPYICRISTDGTKDQPVCRLESAEFLMMAADGKIVTQYAGKLYVTDAETKQKNELYDFAQNGFTDAYTGMQYFDGKVYFVANSMTTEVSEYSGQGFPLTFLIRIDLHDHKAERMVEGPVQNFTLTEQGIYYVPFKMRHLYVPEDYAEHPEQVSLCLFDDSLYFCDLDGNNTKKVYSNDQLDFSYIFTVIDNTLYGWMFDYNEQTHAYDKTFFGSIDLDSGRVVHTEKPADK